MSKLGSFTLHDIEWDIYEGFAGNQIILQRDCPDCDRGILLAPARFCWKCSGSGYLNQKVELGERLTVPENKCSECGAEWYLVVDGRHMTEDKLIHYDRVPKAINRYINHALTCTHRERTIN